MSVKAAATGRSTWKTFAAVHASPPLRIFAATAHSTAAGRSASAKTTKGAWPPSSRLVRSTRSADSARRCRPTAVEPVNVSLRSRGSASSASVASSSDETTTFRTPGGAPAPSTISASARADSGVRADGRSTTVQPAASAAATPRAGIASGKFHGLTIRQGPRGDGSP